MSAVNKATLYTDSSKSSVLPHRSFQPLASPMCNHSFVDEKRSCHAAVYLTAQCKYICITASEQTDPFPLEAILSTKVFM